MPARFAAMLVALLLLATIGTANAATYTGTLTVAEDGLTVNVTANVTPTPNNYRFWWGDGTRRVFDRAKTASHTYAAPGIYEIVVDVASRGVRHLGVIRQSVTVGEPDPDPGPANGLLPYTADSYFKSRVDNATVDNARTSSFRSFMATHPDQRSITWPKLNMNENWAMSYDYGTADDPIWHLAGGNTTNSRLAVVAAGGRGFHMSDSTAGTFPNGGQDRPGVIIDLASGFTVQFADAVPNMSTRTITVSNAGIMWHSSNGLDYRNPRSDDPRNFTSRGRILDSMIVTREELDAAVARGTGVGKVLHLFFVETQSADGFVHPMVGAESGKSGWGAEGERVRLRPDVDLAARGLTGHALALARTLQQNGAYIGDNSGSSTQVKLSQPSHYTGTNLTTDVFKGKITWDDFEVVARG